MARIISILLLLFIIGFVLKPDVAYACQAKAGKSCCKKKSRKNTASKCCCKNNKHTSKKTGDCGGNCGDKSCHCTPVSHAFAVVSPLLILQFEHVFLPKEKNISAYRFNLSDGHNTVWLPPKIGRLNPSTAIGGSI